MADQATEAAAPTEATEQATSGEATAVEPAKYDPKRSFAAHVQEHAARIEAAKTEGEASEQPAEKAPEAKSEGGKVGKQPPGNRPPPPNKLGSARKAFFEERAAKQQAAAATEQAQTAEQRLAALETEVAKARGDMDRARELFDKGDFDGALKLINARGVDSFEAMQKRYLAQLKDTPASDPRMEELKSELDAIKKERADEKRAQAEAQAQEQERLQTDSLYQAVCETTANSDNPDVKRLSAVPGFNEQILDAVRRFPNASEDQIFEVVTQGFDGLEVAFLERRGFTPEQIQVILTGNVPGDAKTEAKAASPARPSAKVETAKAVQPSQHKPTVTISTNAAESTHAARQWDPKSRARDFEDAKRRHVPQSHQR